MRRAVIDGIGLFDETFCDERDGAAGYCLRAAAGGWQLAVAEDCYVLRAAAQGRRAAGAGPAGAALIARHGSAIVRDRIAQTRDHPALAWMRQRCLHIPALAQLRRDAVRRFGGRRVLFLLPAITAGGGSNVVVAEAAAMRRLGVDAQIANLERHRVPFERCYPDLQVPVAYLAGTHDLPGAAQGIDAVVATVFTTVAWLAPLCRVEGGPVPGYYIQDFEPDFFAPDSAEYARARSSYTAIPGMRLFAKTAWTCERVRQETGVRPVPVGPSVDADRFHPPAVTAPASARLRVLAMVRPATPRRAPEATMRVLKRLQARLDDAIDIAVFGVDSQDPEFRRYPRDFPHECLGELSPEVVREAFAAADIFVDCSSFQAMGLTAMEAMASGVAVVGPQEGGLREIVGHEHDGLLVDTGDEEAVLAALVRLATDHALRRKIRANAVGVVRHAPMAAACRMLECLFGDADAAPPERRTDFLG